MENFDLLITDLDDTLWPALDPGSVLCFEPTKKVMLYKQGAAALAPLIKLNPYVVEILRIAERASVPVVILTNNYQALEWLVFEVLRRYNLSTDNVRFLGVGPANEPTAVVVDGHRVLAPLLIDKAAVTKNKIGDISGMRVLFLDDRPENGKAMEALGATFIRIFPDWY